MGKGDIKTKKGKIKSGSYGNSRPHKPSKGKVATLAVVGKPKKVKVENEVSEEPVKKVAKKTTKKTVKKTKEASEE